MIVREGQTIGKINLCKCGKCGCTFEFDRKDLLYDHVYLRRKNEEESYALRVKYVSCPICENNILLDSYDQNHVKEMPLSKFDDLSVPPNSIIEEIDINDSITKIYEEAKHNEMDIINWLKVKKYFNDTKNSL